MQVDSMRWWDIDAVHALEGELFPDDAWSAEQFWQELAQSTRRYLVAREGDDVIGYAGVFVLPPDADIAAAQHLYGRLGFVRIGERRRYYPDGGDALIMRRARGEVVDG